MADFAAPTPDDDQQPAASEPASPGVGADTVADTAAEAAGTSETVVAETVMAPEAATEPEVETSAPPTSPEPLAAAEPPAPEPLPEPTPESVPESVPAIDAPSIASTIEVPASAPAVADGEGGEWELLVRNVTTWLRSGQLQQQWQTARKPLSLLAGLIALLLALRIYGALLGVLDSLPLIPGLLELVGVITVVRFSLTRLVRSEERQQLIEGLQQRWKSFRGQG
jgi:hypothetical protein